MSSRIAGNEKNCWFSKTKDFDEVNYSGNVATSKTGERCLNWLDNQGRICEKYGCENHNHCRKYGEDEAWCYVNEYYRRRD